MKKGVPRKMVGRSIEETMVLRKAKELEKAGGSNERNIMFELSAIGKKNQPVYNPDEDSEEEDFPQPNTTTRVRSVALVHNDHNQEVTDSLTKYCRSLQSRVAVR